ncbi:MAG: beta-glucosidase [Paucibacter sp.]|nr:beta-glucosidase [Roseateles sp.]
MPIASPLAETTAQRLLSDRVRACLGPDFVWGVATSSYQIEGGVGQGGRGESIWDRFCATPGKVRNGDSGRIACDHVNRWPEDLDLIQAGGFGAYRFSIAWPRVQPDGGAGSAGWNSEGLGFYDRLVDGMLERGLAPHATLYHWDLPQALQDVGGWTVRETAQRFADYAEQMGRRLGDRLASLSTHNEPWCTAILGHLTGQFAPGWTDEGAMAQTSHHLLLSHGLALQALRAAGVSCPLGIVLNMSSASAASDDPADVRLAEREYARMVRWFIEPLLLGRYPPEAEWLAPMQREGDMALIAQPLDFLGVNYYTRIWASSQGLPAPRPHGVTDMGWEIYPSGLSELLLRLHSDYRLPPVMITENGMANPDSVQAGRVPDLARIDYLRQHLEALADAKAAGVDLRGYFAWSLLDNFEWDSGYGKRFGLVHVDYATQVRTPKDSYRWMQQNLKQVKQEVGTTGAS